MNYQRGYLLLFNRITDALEALEAQNFGAAGEILRQAQIDGEELYIFGEEDDGQKGRP